MTAETNYSPYISVYQPMAGWKAVMFWWNPELGGFWEPYKTSRVAFATEEEAINWGKIWAEAEGLDFKY